MFHPPKKPKNISAWLIFSGPFCMGIFVFLQFDDYYRGSRQLLLWLLQSLLGQNIHRFSSNGWKEDKRAEQQRNNDQTNMRRRDITTSSRCFHIAKLFLLRGKSCNFLVFFYVLLLLNSRLTSRTAETICWPQKYLYPNGRRLPKQNLVI